MDENHLPSASRGRPTGAPGLTSNGNDDEANNSQAASSEPKTPSINVKVKTLAGADHQFNVPDISVRQFKAQIASTLVNTKKFVLFFYLHILVHSC